jgi:prevent-host-death family protein
MSTFPNVSIANKSYFGFNGLSNAVGRTMKTMSARDAKNGFGLMIDTARAEPVLIEKHGRGVVVVMAIEEYERLSLRPGGADRGKTGVKEASKRGQ